MNFMARSFFTQFEIGLKRSGQYLKKSFIREGILNGNDESFWCLIKSEHIGNLRIT